MTETMVEMRILMLLCGLLYYHVSGFQEGDWIKIPALKPLLQEFLLSIVLFSGILVSYLW